MPLDEKPSVEELHSDVDWVVSSRSSVVIMVVGEVVDATVPSVVTSVIVTPVV